jgi:hypothetical protein
MTNYIYIIELEEDKWYVGKTTNIIKRIKEHKSGIGSSWTTKFKPKDNGIINKFVSTTLFDEDNKTIELMAKYGIDNVRGGSFTKIVLDNNTKNIINNMISTMNDKCFKCGEKGHFINDCKNKNTTFNYIKLIESLINTNNTDNKCLLCENKPDNIGIFVPDISIEFGGSTNKQRIIKYLICNLCINNKEHIELKLKDNFK